MPRRKWNEKDPSVTELYHRVGDMQTAAGSLQKTLTRIFNQLLLIEQNYTRLADSQLRLIDTLAKIDNAREVPAPKPTPPPIRPVGANGYRLENIELENKRLRYIKENAQ